VGHVEAGLRTFDPYSPDPEEMNRSLVGRIAQLHFAPTDSNRRNLQAEGISEWVFITGNTVIDAMGYTVKGGRISTSTLPELDYENRQIIAMTCHRRENYGKPMEDIFSAVRQIAHDFPAVDVVFPVHLAPIVQECAKQFLSYVPNIYLIPPLDTLEMHYLLSKCHMVLTDSGGLQEEAPALGKPVLVLRRETERPEAVEAGCVVLAGTDSARIYELTKELLTDKTKYAQMARAVNPYGDGLASKRIADAILWHFNYISDKPGEFSP
jgi:UDP-N-acetylglucosamine 2-epimerase (non-hydrolysing)